MQDINLKDFNIPGFHLDENIKGRIGEVFYVSDKSEEDSIEIIPDYNNSMRQNEKYYIILYLKDCQNCKVESFGSEIKDPTEALKNMNSWINVSIPDCMRN